MKKRQTRFLAPAVDAAIGYAADAQGCGVAYARVAGVASEHLLRVPFRVRRSASLPDREAGYAALTAVVQTLRGRGFGRISVTLDDASLIDDLSAHRDVPPTIVLPYVRLRCELNQLDDFAIAFAAPSDLAQRARAEVALNVAA